MTSDQSEPSQPSEGVPPTEANSPATSQPASSTPTESSAPRVKIGSQRPGSARIKAAPRPQPIFERRSPVTAPPADAPAQKHDKPASRPQQPMDEASIEQVLERPLPEVPAAVARTE